MDYLSERDIEKESSCEKRFFCSIGENFQIFVWMWKRFSTERYVL